MSLDWRAFAACSASHGNDLRRIQTGLEKLGLTYDVQELMAIVDRCFVAVPPRNNGQKPSAEPTTSQRDEAIIAAAAAGETYAVIGERYGLTRQRIQQIVASVRDMPAEQVKRIVRRAA